MNIKLHVLNVQTAIQNGNTIAEWPQKDLFATLNPEYHLINETTNVDEAILGFAEKNEFSWLVVMPRKHSFFDALMHKSHTRALVHHSHIPILAIHEQQ
jgi:hypothetical protein